MIRNIAKRSRRKFRAKIPHFGTKTSPKPLKDQQISPYYWWWAYLKRSKQYIACCARGGQGKLAKLYADFGDVRGDDFKSWWTENDRGRELFSEPRSVAQVIELKNKDEWLDDWNTQSTMVIAMPLDWTKRDLKKRLLALLKNKPLRGPGKQPMKGTETSDAKYPLARNFNTNSLKVGLAVYEAVEARISNGEKKTYDEIGISLKLVRTAMPTQLEIKSEKRNADSVNTMTVAVSRHYTRAKKVVENVSKGVFP